MDTEARPPSCSMGNPSLPRITRPERKANNPPTSITEVKERVQYYTHFPSGPPWHVLGWTLPFTTAVNHRQKIRRLQPSPYRSNQLPHEGEKNLMKCKILVMGSNAMTSLSLVTVRWDMFNTYNASGVILAALFRRLVVIKRKVNTTFMQRINEMEQNPWNCCVFSTPGVSSISSATFMIATMRVHVLSEEVTVEQRYQCRAH